MRRTRMQHVEEAAEALEELEAPKVVNLQGGFRGPTGFRTLEGFSILGHARRLSPRRGGNQAPEPATISVPNSIGTSQLKSPETEHARETRRARACLNSDCVLHARAGKGAQGKNTSARFGAW